MDLTTATPVEIDTALAEIYSRLYKVEDEIAQNLRFMEDLEKGIEKEAEGNRQYSGYARMYGQEVLDYRDKIRNLQEQRVAILAETAPYEAEYRSRPWSRFFLVTNNGGHIHSSMSCSTCFPTTRFGWLPEESGKDEEAAVAAHGAILCTVCFPSAPVEWTQGKVDPDQCEGSGRYYDRDLPHRVGYYSGNWAECPVCHAHVTVTKGLKFRKHKRPA